MPPLGSVSSVTDLRILSATSEWVTAGLREASQVTVLIDDLPRSDGKEQVDLLVVDSHWLRNAGSVPRATIAWCTGRGIPTVYWYTSDASSCAELGPPAREFDLVFCANADAMPCVTAAMRPGRRAMFLPPAARWPPPSPVPLAGRSIGLAYVGGLLTARTADWLRPLRRHGLRVFASEELGPAGRVGPGYEEFEVDVEPALDVIARLDEIQLAVCVDPDLSSAGMNGCLVYEALARGAHPLVSTGRGHMSRSVQGGVTRARDAEELEGVVTRLRRDGVDDRLLSTGNRIVVNQHTYSHRLATIASTAGGHVLARPPRLTGHLTAEGQTRR